MLTDSQKKKFMAFFNQLDSDKNGAIDFEDFKVQAYNTKIQKGWDDDSDEWIAFCKKAMEKGKTVNAPGWLTRIL